MMQSLVLFPERESVRSDILLTFVTGSVSEPRCAVKYVACNATDSSLMMKVQNG